jgi:hypothetical protein
MRNHGNRQVEKAERSYSTNQKKNYCILPVFYRFTIKQQNKLRYKKDKKQKGQKNVEE